MHRRMILAVILATCGLHALAADLPTAESILDRYVEATGGKQAYAARKTEIMRGTLSYPAQGLSGAIVRYEADPNQHYTSITIPEIGLAEEGVSNGVAWERSDLLGARIKQGAERSQALRDGMLNATAHWRDLFLKVAFAGTDTVNGEDCYKVVLTPSDGAPETMYFSIKSGLALKGTATAPTQMGDLPVEIMMSDYKKFGSFTEASKISQKVAGQDLVITIGSLETNAPIPASRFELPADVQAIAAKSKP